MLFQTKNVYLNEKSRIFFRGGGRNEKANIPQVKERTELREEKKKEQLIFSKSS